MSRIVGERMRASAMGICLLAVVIAAGAAAAQEGAGAASAVTADVSFGTGVDRAARSLEGPAAAFGPDVGTVFCLARVQGAEPPLEVTFAWYHEGKTMAKVPLTVRSGDYRTWSSKNIMPAWTGAWEVKLLDPSGRVIATGSFTVE